MRAVIAIAIVSACGGSGGGDPDALGTADARGDAGSDGATTNHYETDFDGDEAPLSEGGAWSHAGQDWRTAVKTGGYAFGTQTGTGGYDDSYALLSGFSPDQTASGVIHLVPTIDPSCTHEVEILLRW